MRYVSTRKGRRYIKFSDKKGSLELSINAIVVLILAITMLGLGLGFMRSTFGKATKQFKEIGEEVKKQLIDRLKSSEEPIALSVFSIEMEKSSRDTVLMGVRNNLGCGDRVYNVEVIDTECQSLADIDGNCESVDIGYFEEQEVAQNDVGIVPLNIQTASNSRPDTLKFPIEVSGECPGGTPSYSGRVELLIDVV